MGRPAFLFIDQGKAWVTAEEKEKNERERERKASRIAGSFFSSMRVLSTLYMIIGIAPHHGPVRHWRHAQASSVGNGAPLRPGGRRGELTRLSAFVRGLGRTAPVCPTLFLM